jgi:Oxidoreductase molybdopterin binding domain/Mo-co oxidoreductase dimerisation domain
MERRTFIIAAVAGGIGLIEYSYVSKFMNGIHNAQGFSVKPYEKYGSRAALVAITPNDSFYVTSKGGTPQVKKEDWTLSFEGLVAHPFTLNYKDVVALPSLEKYLTLECISNPVEGGIVGNALWKGTAFKPLLERCSPLAEAQFAIIYAADGFSTGHPISRLWNEENFLAYKMNGEDLPPVHGYPMRIFIPGKFGMKQPKWVTRIKLVRDHYLGYWESSGWSDTCERWAHARFTDPANGAEISGKNFELTGYAIGNLDGMSAVEISLDDGRTWQKTDLYSNPSPLTWSFWKYTWADPKPGQYKIKVRAIDGKGRVEPAGPQDTFPDGATGQETFKIKVV